MTYIEILATRVRNMELTSTQALVWLMQHRMYPESAHSLLDQEISKQAIRECVDELIDEQEALDNARWEREYEESLRFPR